MAVNRERKDGQALEPDEKKFCSRYCPLIFRIIRPYFGDHARAAEYAENFVVDAIIRIREHGRAEFNPTQYLTSILDEARSYGLPGAGSGLSKIQRILLDTLNELPMAQRIPFDFIVFQGIFEDEVCLEFGIHSSRLKAILNTGFTRIAQTEIPARRTPDAKSTHRSHQIDRKNKRPPARKKFPGKHRKENTAKRFRSRQ